MLLVLSPLPYTVCQILVPETLSLPGPKLRVEMCMTDTLEPVY